MTHHPRLPEIMPGQLRLRLAHGYATRQNADAAWLPPELIWDLAAPDEGDSEFANDEVAA